MQNRSVESITTSFEFWMSRLGLPVLGSLLILFMALLALNRLVPAVPGRAFGPTVRMSWYFHSGQWSADVRTLAAASQFVLENEPGGRAEGNHPANLRAAVTPESDSSPSVLVRASDARG